MLDGYRAALRRGADPILVVPTFPDVERYRSELASSGIVFGAQVVRFAWLIDECARRGGVRGRPLAELARERIAATVVKAAPLHALAASARTRGFTRELLRLIDELEGLRVTPQRLTQALRAWAGEDEGRRAYADEVSGLYGGYRRRLERLGRLDAPLLRGRGARRAALRARARGATRRSSSTASTTCSRCSSTRSRRSPRAPPTSCCRCPSRPAGWRSRAARPPSPSCIARASSSAPLKARAEHYAEALARGAAPSRARALRARRGAALRSRPDRSRRRDHAAAGRR